MAYCKQVPGSMYQVPGIMYQRYQVSCPRYQVYEHKPNENKEPSSLAYICGKHAILRICTYSACIDAKAVQTSASTLTPTAGDNSWNTDVRSVDHQPFLSKHYCCLSSYQVYATYAHINTGSSSAYYKQVPGSMYQVPGVMYQRYQV